MYTNISPFTILPILMLIGCSDGTTQAMADYDMLMEDMTALVTDHGDAVAAATTIDEAGTAKEAYLTDWGTVRDAMMKHMDMLGDCTMDDPDQGMMDDANASVTAMDTAVTDHVDAHATHTDIAECQSDEATHDEMMMGEIDMMSGYSAEWEDSMKCMASGMGM